MTTQNAIDNQFPQGTISGSSISNNLIVEATTARTLQPGDAGAIIQCTNGGTTTINIATHANQPIPVGATIYIHNFGSINSLITLTNAGATTVNYNTNITVGLLGFFILQQIFSDFWTVTQIYEEFFHVTKWSWNTFTTASNFSILLIRNNRTVTARYPQMSTQASGSQSGFIQSTTAIPARFRPTVSTREAKLALSISGAAQAVGGLDIDNGGIAYVQANPSGSLSGTSFQWDATTMTYIM